MGTKNHTQHLGNNTGQMEETLQRPFGDLKADAVALSGRVNGHFRVDLMAETILGGYREAREKR